MFFFLVYFENTDHTIKVSGNTFADAETAAVEKERFLVIQKIEKTGKE